MRKLLLTLGLLLIAPTPALAEDPVMNPAWVDLMRDDLRDERRSLVEIAMELEGDDMVAFRGIYGDYETEASALGDRKVAQVMKYADAWPDVSDDLATELATESLSIQKDTLALRKKSWKAVDKALGPQVAARFLQIEMQVAMLIDLQVQSQMPLVHSAGKPTAPAAEPAAEGEALGKPVTPPQ